MPLALSLAVGLEYRIDAWRDGGVQKAPPYAYVPGGWMIAVAWAPLNLCQTLWNWPSSDHRTIRIWRRLGKGGAASLVSLLGGQPMTGTPSQCWGWLGCAQGMPYKVG